MQYNPNWIESIREQYPIGTRIRLESMEDPYAPISPGTEGEINFIDDAGQIHMKWDNGRSLALIPSVDNFSVIAKPIQILKLYMPLSVIQYERDEKSSLKEYPIELDQDTIVSYHAPILATILKVCMLEESERGLMKYYIENDSVNAKVHSYVFTIEQVRDKLMGVGECKIKGKLTEQELEVLKEDILRQASDGFGKDIQQHPIKIGRDEIYVRLWTDSKDWNIMTHEELEVQEQQMVEQCLDLTAGQAGIEMK